VSAPPIADAPPSSGGGPAVMPQRVPVADSPATTASGLVKRTPGGGPAATVGDTDSGRSVARTTRSPEEVRRMLSRYRSGLDRGRTGSLTDDVASTTETPDTANEGAEE